MNFLTIARYRIIQYLRDKKSFISMLVIPIILMAILGTALGSSEDFSGKNIGNIKVLYVNNIKGNNNFDNFMNMPELSDLITATKIDNISEGRKLIEKKEYEALVIYDEDSDSKIQVIGSDYNSLKVSIVKNIMDSYANKANSIEALNKLNSKDFSMKKYNNIKEDSITLTGKKPSAKEYYSITMLIMTILFGSIYANFAIDKDYYSTVGGRIKTAPVKLWEVFLGEGIGVVFTLAWQIAILLLVGRFVFQVDFGGSLPVIIIATLSLAVMSTMMGIFACMATKKGLIGLALLNILVPIFTFLGGGFVKVDFGDGFLGSLSHITPNYLAQSAIFNSMYGGTASSIYMNILGIWILTIIFFLGAKFVGRRDVL
ncbi:ABC transporter permease [Clostridium hydrogeniformans]|uniref:ABC transporter permease n=1 Tax=Clostridium hydrogeniformans TaxID=349933 RepID=UPI0004841D1E|nr:ABC transporter permease [Clostridium hydrogeniformans]